MTDLLPTELSGQLHVRIRVIEVGTLTLRALQLGGQLVPSLPGQCLGLDVVRRPDVDCLSIRRIRLQQRDVRLCYMQNKAPKP